MAISSFGASVGPGPVHCVLLDIEDGRIVGQQARTIDPGPYRLGRRGNLLSSGFDLLASHSDRAVDASAVAVRSRRDLLSVRFGARGGVRAAGVVREPEAVLRALDERGTIARYGTALVADLGAGGMRVFTVSDGAVAAERHTRTVAAARPEGGAGTAQGAADFVRSSIARASAAPEAVVLVGSGAQLPAVREAVSDVARAAGAEPVTVEDPEGVAATGAALLAADRRAAGTAPSSVVGNGIGAIGGHSVRLTAAAVPLLVLAALTGAVLAAGYFTGIIGPAGESTEQVPTSSYSDTTVAEPTSILRPASVTSTLPPAETSLPPTVQSPRETSQDDGVTPTMTTFAPPPVVPTTTRPVPTTTPSPTTRTPTSELPTTILPSVPTGPPSVSPSGSETPGGSVAPGPSGGATAPAGGALPGNGLVAPDRTAAGSSSGPSATVGTNSATAQDQSVTVEGDDAVAQADAPTVTAPAP